MKQTRNKAAGFLCTLVPLIFLVLLDQLTKYAAWKTIRLSGPLELIPGVFELQYLENRGAAFGMMRGMQTVFVVFALLITVLAMWMNLRLRPLGRHYLPLRVVAIVLASGAIGNMIDRVCHHSVIDFLYVSLINFPIFNVADIYVTCGSAALILLMIFLYSDSDLQKISGKKGGNS